MEGDFSTQVFDALQVKETPVPNYSNAMYSNRTSHKYLANDLSEEKFKSDARVDTEYRVNIEEGKSAEPNLQNKNTIHKKSANMIDYILNLDNVLKPNQQNKNKFIDDEEEDEQIENSNPFEKHIPKERQVVDKNLLELNEYQDNQEENFESRIMSSPRSSFPNYVNERLETKQGWLFKRSFKFPNFIGWQRRY